MNLVSNTTFIAEIMNNMVSTMDAQAPQSTDIEEETPAHSSTISDNHGSFALFYGTLIAFFVWFGIYLSSPELFRLSGCFVWISAFYFITNLYFNDNEQVQRAVFSLFSFSPFLAAFYVVDRTRKMDYNELSNDARVVIQFFALFGSIAYFSMYWSPLDMYSFLVNDFMELTIFERLISVFIAMSIGAFCMILVQNCKHLSSVLYPNEDEHGMTSSKIIDSTTSTIVQNLEITPTQNSQIEHEQTARNDNNKMEQTNKPKENEEEEEERKEFIKLKKQILTKILIIILIEMLNDIANYLQFIQ